MSLRKAAVCVLLLIAVATVRAEDVEVEGEDAEEVVEQRTYGLAGIETVEPTFIEESAAASAEVDASGFPIPLTKRQRRNTVEPRYLGEKKVKAWVAPEYAVRRKSKKLRSLRNKKQKPRVFKSHYFSPMPKPKKGVRYPPPPGVPRNRRNRRKKNLVPLFSAETPASHNLHKGYIIPEMMNKLPNKYDPIDRSKFTMAPAPSTVPPKPYTTADNAAKANAVPPALVETEAESETETEVDTSAEAEAQFEAENGANPPPFSEEEMGDRHIPTMVESNNFAAEGFMTPDWNDEAAPSDFSMSEEALHAQDEEEGSDEEEAEPSLIEAAATAEDEEEEEADEEEEAEDESEEEETDESDSEEEADEEAEDEAEDEEEAEEGADEIALVESAARIFGVEGLTADQFNAMDEMAQNEVLVRQVDMDATSDEDAARASDEEEEASEQASDEAEGEAEAEGEGEAESEGEGEADTQELEENEMDTNEALAELVETQSLDQSVDTLLTEVDAHLTAHIAGEGEADSEAEAEAEAKGTPGAAVGAGMTWDEANANAAEEAEAEEKAAAAAVPKVPAKVVASTADLHNSEPEFDSEPAHVEMSEPQMVDALPEQTAQMVLLEKIAKLKALRRN